MSQAKQYDDTNTGIIGSNDYKQKDTHPDQRGRINIDGVWYWLSGWDKEANGRKFTSLSATIMTQAEVDNMLAKRAERNKPQQAAQQRQQSGQPQQRQQAQGQQNPGNEPGNFDDDIPF